MPNKKIALVTGASSGIGRACARALAQENWTTLFVGRDAAKLTAAVADLPPHLHAACDIQSCDLSDPPAVAQLFAYIDQQYGRLDLLFNNAGVSQKVCTPDELPAAEWRRVVGTNLDAAFYCLSGAFALMRKQNPQGGRIINNGSISAQVPRPGAIAYAASKSAITGLTRAAALDGRPFNIAVGQIDIGNVKSDMTTGIAAGALQADGSTRAEACMDMSAVVATFIAMTRLPLEANVFHTTVMASGMPFVGRG